MDFENEKKQEEMSAEQNAGSREGYPSSSASGNYQREFIPDSPVLTMLNAPTTINRVTTRQASVPRDSEPGCRVHLSVAAIVPVLHTVSRVVAISHVLSRAAIRVAAIIPSKVISHVLSRAATVPVTMPRARDRVTSRVAISSVAVIRPAVATSPVSPRRNMVSHVAAISSAAAISPVSSVLMDLTILVARSRRTVPDVSIQLITIPMQSTA